MAKVILVMEEPTKCEECILHYINIHQGRPLCAILAGHKGLGPKEYVEVMEDAVKPDWCPLKSLPKKRDGHFTYDEYGDGWDAGFNACIDEILKEEKWV